jgi:dTDP-4-dehydrorhamnose reductase
MKKIIVLGSSGMAGHVVTKQLKDFPDKYQTISVSRTKDSTNASIIMDISDFGKLKRFIESEVPNVIINCVGVLNKYAEENPDVAILMNSYLPHFLESVTRKMETKIIHISTDCVFSGSKGNYLEDDFKDGNGFYAQTKALGEINNAKDLTIRTSIIGPELKKTGIGLLHWFLQQEGKVNGYIKAYWSGVTTIQLGKSILDILEMPELSGIVHLTNNEKINKFDLIELFKKVFNKKEIEIEQFDKYKVDKSILNTRSDFSPNVPSYENMIIEMFEWMQNNNSLYFY